MADKGKKKFKYKLGGKVKLLSGEIGTVRGRAEYLHAEDSYYVLYVGNDGVQREIFWGESALQEAK